MKIEDQVCTLDQAKRLNDLGVVQGASAFYHNTNSGEIEHNSHHKTGTFYHAKYCFSAFTVAELAVMLPRYYPSWRFLKEGGQEELWIATVIGQPEGYNRDKEDVMDIRTTCAFDRYSKTQAEALAALLISLLETNTEPAEEVNKRLEA